ncbi:thioesterase domain-containing protein, partial [Rhodococcoides corynebacterioides]
PQAAPPITDPGLLPDLLDSLDSPGGGHADDQADDRAHRIARELVACGAGPGDVVAVAMRSRPDRVLGIRATTASGAAATLVDPDEPAERVLAALDACHAAWILTTDADAGGLAAVAPWLPRLILGDREAEESIARRRRGPLTDADRRASLRPDSAAVVAHRPGVATRPVTVTHRDLLDRLSRHRGRGHDVIAALLATIEDLAGASDAVVRLADGDGSSTLFCIHPMMGLAWPYLELSRYLDPRTTVWGVQTPALVDPSFRPTTLADLVQRYADEIAAVDAPGPCHLLGWSVGGVLAQAITAALAERGRSVASLVLLDPVHGPDPDGPVARARSEATFGGPDPRPAGVTDLGPDDLATVWHTVGGDQLSLTDAQAQRVATAMVRVHDLLVGHVPAPVGTDVLVIDSAVTAAHLVRTSDFWRARCTGRVRTAEVPFRHGELLSSDALLEVGPVVASWMASVSGPATVGE